MLLSISLPLFSADDLPLLNLKGGTIYVKQLAVELDISIYFSPEKHQIIKKYAFLLRRDLNWYYFHFLRTKFILHLKSLNHIH